MPEDDATRYRKQAKEAREQAERAISPVHKDAWLRVNYEWLKLAHAAERAVREARKLRRYYFFANVE
jgi:hypothetical protein